jgi:hypothetical protein
MKRMKPPKGLGADGRRAWREACAALEAAGLDPALTIGELERYSRAADRLAVVEAAWVELGRPVMAEGSKGQLIAHPLVAALRAETAAVHELAKALLPASAAGWRRGSARAPDRAARGPARRAGGNVFPLSPEVDALLEQAGRGSSQRDRAQPHGWRFGARPVAREGRQPGGLRARRLAGERDRWFARCRGVGRGG